MKKFLIKLLVFGVVFFAADKLFYPLENISPTKEVDKRLEYLLQGKINQDILIFGSSRGARNIMAEEIEISTGLSAYNLSYPGSSIEFHEFLVRTALSNNKKPKLIILCVDNAMTFLPAPALNFRLDRLYPLVKYDAIVDELISRGEKNEYLSQFFYLHKLSKSNFDIQQKKFNAKDTISKLGSMPISFSDSKEKWKIDTLSVYDQKREEKVKVVAFEKIIAMCQKNKIPLVLVSPPLYDYQRDDFFKIVQSRTPKNVHYYVFNKSNPIYTNKDYFFDKTHLKRNGAELFSRELGKFVFKKLELQND